MHWLFKTGKTANQVIGHNDKAYRKEYYQIPAEFSWVCIESFDSEFPTGLELPRTILSLVCLEPDRCCKSFSWAGHAPLTTPSPLTSQIPHAAFKALHCSVLLSLSLFPTQLASFLVRPDEQVVNKYLLGQVFLCLKTFHLCSASRHSQISHQSYTDFEYSTSIWEVLCLSYCKCHTKHCSVAKSASTISPTRANMLGIRYYSLIINSRGSLCFHVAREPPKQAKRKHYVF